MSQLEKLPCNKAGSTSALESRLERGEIVTFHPSPFPLPESHDLAFLMRQQLQSSVHKNISYDPARDTLSGSVRNSPAETERLKTLLRTFSAEAVGWLRKLLPGYARTWSLDRASFRTEEEATRKLRTTARNDLLHFDAFPSRPTRGHRILRLYVNINPADDRVWMTSDSFAKVLEKYGSQVGLPTRNLNTWVRRLGKGLVGIFQPGVLERTEYDEFMLRLHHFLKSNDEFQEKSLRHLAHFKPGSAWLLFSDAISHAELRGQYALEHSFFISPTSLVLPEESPLALLEGKCADGVLPRAA